MRKLLWAVSVLAFTTASPLHLAAAAETGESLPGSAQIYEQMIIGGAYGTFVTVPAGKTLVLKNISCGIQYLSPRQSNLLVWGSPAEKEPYGDVRLVLPINNGFTPVGQIVPINLDLLAFVPSGQQLALLAFSNDPSITAQASFQCTLAGYYIPNPK